MARECSMDAEERQRQELELKRFETMFRMNTTSMEKAFEAAKLLLLGNGAGLGLCATAFKDYRDKIGPDVLTAAASWFGWGIVAAGICIAFTCLATEIAVMNMTSLFMKSFSAKAIAHYRSSYDPEQFNGSSILLAYLIIAVPYVLSALCFSWAVSLLTIAVQK
jgi:hypothetical protein